MFGSFFSTLSLAWRQEQTITCSCSCDSSRIDFNAAQMTFIYIYIHIYFLLYKWIQIRVQGNDEFTFNAFFAVCTLHPLDRYKCEKKLISFLQFFFIAVVKLFLHFLYFLQNISNQIDFSDWLSLDNHIAHSSDSFIKCKRKKNRMRNVGNNFFFCCKRYASFPVKRISMWTQKKRTEIIQKRRRLTNAKEKKNEEPKRCTKFNFGFWYYEKSYRK